MNNNVVILIPAYNPTLDLIILIQNLKENLYPYIVVINDGSFSNYKKIFEVISSDCTIINHKTNMGKGCALKTGFEYIIKNFSSISTIITVDADGQHLITDINKVAQASICYPNSLILGCRNFKESTIPFRNKLGNILMRLVFNLIYKSNILDTQTGLRAIPITSINQLLSLKGCKYEYEQNILIYFTKNFKKNIHCVEISTIYNKNQISYFNAFKDSIYIVKCLFKKKD